MNCFTISIHVSEMQVCNLSYIQAKRTEFLLTAWGKQETIKHDEMGETVRIRCLEERVKGDKEEATHVYYD